MMKRIAIFAALCGVMKLVLAVLPEPAILASFCRVPAEVAAFYYGVPLEIETLSFTAKGVTLAVTLACAATDFFALIAVETSAQEKALKQKEMEALYGNKAFDFEEPPEESPTSSDAPGMLLILGGFLVVLLLRRKWFNLVQRHTFIQ